MRDRKGIDKMCQFVEIKKDVVPSNIRIEFERDASLRAVEILIINHKRDGSEGQAVKIIASDTGKIMSVSPAVDLIEGLDIF